MWIYKLLNKISPERFFLCVSLSLGILLNLFMPPLQTPDEFNHFYRAYQISEGQFLPQSRDHRLGGEMPYDLNHFIRPFKFMSRQVDYKLRNEDLATAFKTRISSKDKEFRDFPNTSYYSPVSYLPQAFAIFILRQFTLSAGILYYGGRIFTFLVWIVCMFFVIKLLPAYKWLITILILLPTQVYITNSFSADTVTNILSFLLLALVLKCALQSMQVSRRELYLIFLIAVLLALAKVVYVGLVLLVFVIPANKFKSKSNKYVFISLVLLVSLTLAFTWSQAATHFYISYKGYNSDFVNEATVNYGSDYYGQKAYILSHGPYFLKVIYNSIFNPEQNYLEGYVARFGAFNDFPMPKWIIVSAYLFILLVLLIEKNSVTLSFKQKSSVLVTAFFSLALILLSQHLTWDSVGSGVVELVQGRYLIPLFPLVFILLSQPIKSLTYNPVFLSIVFILFINIAALRVIYERYVYDPYQEKIEFYCNVEHLDSGGALITSDPLIKLQEAGNRSSKEHRSGKFSECLSARFPYGFTYVFYNLNAGDLFEIEAWKKGKGGQINLSGGGPGIKDFYFPDDYVEYREKDGWDKMHKLFRLPENVKGGHLGFFISPVNSEVYFDDIRIILRKRKKAD